MPTHTEIEAIVRAVLQRLRGSDEMVATQRNIGLPAATETVSSSAMQFRWEAQLLTLENLRDHWKGLRSVCISTKCIVTPAVKDELRQRGVTLERVFSAVTSGGTVPVAAAQPLLVLAPQASLPGLGRLLAEVGAGIRLVELETSGASQGLSEHLSGELGRADKVARLSESSWQAKREANKEFGGRHLIGGAINDSGAINESEGKCLWFTPRPFAAVAECRSLAAARAVQLSSLHELPAALEQASPNVIVVDATQWRLPAVANLARQWSRSAKIQ